MKRIKYKYIAGGRVATITTKAATISRKLGAADTGLNEKVDKVWFFETPDGAGSFWHYWSNPKNEFSVHVENSEVLPHVEAWCKVNHMDFRLGPV